MRDRGRPVTIFVLLGSTALHILMGEFGLSTLLVYSLFKDSATTVNSEWTTIRANHMQGKAETGTSQKRLKFRTQIASFP